MLCTIEPNINKKSISAAELFTSNLHTAQSFYMDELKWDSLMYIRSISFDFQSDDEQAIDSWYRKLITKIPEYLYYLSEDDFNRCMDLIVNSNEPLFSYESRYSKFYFENAVQQIAANDDELQPLVDIICEQISCFPLKEAVNEKNDKAIDSVNRKSNVIWLCRRRGKLNR